MCTALMTMVWARELMMNASEGEVSHALSTSSSTSLSSHTAKYWILPVSMRRACSLSIQASQRCIRRVITSPPMRVSWLVFISSSTSK